MEYYSSLGLNKGASASEVKKAYRKKAMKFHPDKNPGNKQAEAKFKEINEAYEVLSDPQKKAAYDKFGVAGINNNSQQRPPNPHDIFEEMFGGFSGQFDSFFRGNSRNQRHQHQHHQTQRKGTDIHIGLSISFSDCIHGAEKSITYNLKNRCEPCQGTGSEEPLETCPQCHGTGQISFARGFMNLTSTCNVCNGTGKIIKVPCRFCKGLGFAHKRTNSILNIPKGIRPGQRLKVDGAGNLDGSSSPGDLYVDIKFDKSNFEIKDNDIITKTEVDCVNAILGCSMLIDTVDGEKLVKFPAGIQDGNKVRIPGEGLPIGLGSNSRGNFLIEVKVKVLKNITTEVRELLEKVRENI